MFWVCSPLPTHRGKDNSVKDIKTDLDMRLAETTEAAKDKSKH